MKVPLTLLKSLFTVPFTHPFAKILFRRPAENGVKNPFSFLLTEQAWAEVFAGPADHQLEFVVAFPFGIVIVTKNQLAYPWESLVIWVRCIKVLSQTLEHFPVMISQCLIQGIDGF